MKVWLFDAAGSSELPAPDPASDVLTLRRDDGSQRIVWIARQPPLADPLAAGMAVATRSSWRSDAQTPLYARWVSGTYRVSRIAEACEISHAMLPEVSGQAGFVAVYMAFAAESGRTFSISIWDRPEDADANVNSGWYRKQVARFDGIYTTPPVREDMTIVDVHRGRELELRPEVG